MDVKGAKRISNVTILRWVARGLLVLWAALWMFFNLGSGIHELGEYGYGATGWGSLGIHFLMAAVAVVFLWAAWKYELHAGVLLMVAAAFGFFFFTVGERISEPGGASVFWFFLMPVFLSGTILAWCHLNDQPDEK